MSTRALMNTFRWMLLGCALGFSMSLVSCGTANKCTPSSCQFGCCDSAGTCQTGASDAQCGQQGAMCQACGIGRLCQLGICVGFGGTGGGTTGGGTTGGGTTGGGTTGGGGGTTGGGTTGGGTTGGGTTGGGGGTNTTCGLLQTNVNTFLAGRTTCGTDFTLPPTLTTQCFAAIVSCNSTDQTTLRNFGTCISQTPCTPGNEAAAQTQFGSCSTDLSSLSPACRTAFQGGATGGGGTAGCSPANCNGCCAGDVCNAGAQNTLCGANGNTCVDCTANALTCSNGQCGGGASCTVTSSNFGNRGTVQGVATFAPTDGGVTNQFVSFNGALSSGTPYDELAVELYAGSGVFANGIAPGTYSISGAELNYATCGLCVLVRTQSDSTNFADVYLAMGGSVTISQVSNTLGSTFAATVNNVNFQHVTIASGTFTSTPVNDGCVTSLTSASFSAPLTP